MVLHRAVMRGKGFYEWMTRPASALPDEPVTPRPLPVVNLLAAQDQRYVDALIEEAMPGDRAPFREYLVNRFLGIGIITAVRSTLLAHTTDTIANCEPRAGSRLW